MKGKRHSSRHINAFICSQRRIFVNYIAVVEDSAQDRAVLDSYLENTSRRKTAIFKSRIFRMATRSRWAIRAAMT